MHGLPCVDFYESHKCKTALRGELVNTDFRLNWVINA